jgi:hypothetical protein
MNKVRNTVIFIVAAVIIICSFLIIKSATKKPQSALDFTFTTESGEQHSLKDTCKNGGVLVFFDPDVEGSNKVLERIIKNAGDIPVIAVSTSKKTIAEQKELLPKAYKKLKYVSFDSAEILKLYNIGNAPVTYFINNEFLVTNAFVGNIKQKTILKCLTFSS